VDVPSVVCNLDLGFVVCVGLRSSQPAVGTLHFDIILAGFYTFILLLDHLMKMQSQTD